MLAATQIQWTSFRFPVAHREQVFGLIDVVAAVRASHFISLLLLKLLGAFRCSLSLLYEVNYNLRMLLLDFILLFKFASRHRCVECSKFLIIIRHNSPAFSEIIICGINTQQPATVSSSTLDLGKRILVPCPKHSRSKHFRGRTKNAWILI